MRGTRVAPQVTAIGNVDEQTAFRAHVVVGDRTVARTGASSNGLRDVLGPAYSASCSAVGTVKLHLVSELNNGARRDEREGCGKGSMISKQTLRVALRTRDTVACRARANGASLLAAVAHMEPVM